MKFFYKGIFFWCFFWSVPAVSQTVIDSLRSEYFSESNDNIRVNLAKQLFAKYVYTQVDSAIYFAEQVVELGEQLGSKKDRVAGLKYLGIAYTIKGDYATALNYMNEDLKVHIAEDDSINIAYSYNNIGLNYLYAGDFLNSSDNFIKSVRIKEELVRRGLATAADLDLASTLLNIGITYESQSDTLHANEYYSMALDEAVKAEDISIAAKTRSTLASLLISQKKFESALLYLKEAEGAFIDQNDIFALGKIYNNLALAYAELENGPQTISYALKSIEANQQLGNELSEGLGMMYLGLGYIKTKEYDKAIEISKQALKLGLKLEANELISGSYKNLREAYSFIDDYKRAYEYSLRSEEVDKEIYALERAEQIERLSAQYEADKREIEIDQLNQETDLKSLQLAKASSEKNLLIVFLVSAIIILLLTIYFYRKIIQNRKTLRLKNSELEALNQTKDRFFAIISHDLRGHISAFQGTGRLLKHFSAKNDHEKIEKITTEIDNNASNLSHLLDNLLQWSLDQLNGYEPKPENVVVLQVVEELINTYKPFAEAKGIEFKSSISESDVVYVDRGGFFVVLRNLITNALKFTEKGSVTIFSKIEANRILIGVEDTGIGIPEDMKAQLFKIDEDKIRRGTKNEKGTGLGLHLAHEFTRLNGGVLTMKSEEGKGTTFFISLNHA